MAHYGRSEREWSESSLTGEKQQKKKIPGAKDIDLVAIAHCVGQKSNSNACGILAEIIGFNLDHYNM
jgi:hypothetical protein